MPTDIRLTSPLEHIYHTLTLILIIKLAQPSGSWSGVPPLCQLMDDGMQGVINSSGPCWMINLLYKLPPSTPSRTEGDSAKASSPFRLKMWQRASALCGSIERTEGRTRQFYYSLAKRSANPPERLVGAHQPDALGHAVKWGRPPRIARQNVVLSS